MWWPLYDGPLIKMKACCFYIALPQNSPNSKQSWGQNMGE